MTTVILETPYAGDVKRNVAFARACMLDCLKRGEAPFASHLLYTQVLDDDVSEERELGIAAGFAWREKSTRTVVYTNLGVSRGMEAGIAHAMFIGRPIEYRTLEGAW